MNHLSIDSFKNQSNAESFKPSSRAFPVTLLMCGILSTLIAACAIPALVATTGHLTLPSSFAWVDSIGTRYVAVLAGTSGALGLSMIVLSIRSFRQTKLAMKMLTIEQAPEQTPTSVEEQLLRNKNLETLIALGVHRWRRPSYEEEVLSSDNTTQPESTTTPTAQTLSLPTTVQQKPTTTLCNNLNSVKIADLKDWSELTEKTAQRLGLINPATMNLEEGCFGFYADDHMVKSGGISKEDFLKYRGMVSTYVVARTNGKLVFMGKIDDYQEKVKCILQKPNFNLKYQS